MAWLIAGWVLCCQGPPRLALADGAGGFIPRELHVIGVYEGRSRRFQDHWPPGDAAVRVQRPGKRVTLFLSSYEAVLWHITVEEGSTVERVFVSGYYRQSVLDLPPEVQVISTSYEDGRMDYLTVGWSLDSGRVLANLPKVSGLAGMSVASFQGAYSSPYPKAFVVDRIQDDPRLAPDYPQPTPVSELPSLEFRMAFSDASSGSGLGTVFFRDYTLAGPVNHAAELLPSAINVVNPPGGSTFYGIVSHSAVRVDSITRTAREMYLGSKVPELSWPMGMTYDTKRQRLLLVSLGGEGYLYGFDPAQNQWSLVASMNNLDLDNLVYHEKEDVLYGLGITHADYDPPRLYRLSPDGKPLGQITLPRLPFDIAPGGYRSELASAGDYLVLLLGPSLWCYAQDSQESRIYLIEPNSGQVWLTYRRWPGVLENQPPTVKLVSPADGTVVPAPEIVPLAAEAGDTDGRVAFVEFFADNHSLGIGTQTDVGAMRQATFRLDWQGMLPGTYALTARASDNGGASTVSTAARVLVGEPPLPPKVIIVTPTDGAQFVAPADVLIEAQATDPSQTLTQLEFRIDSLASGASWIIVLPPMPPGVPDRNRFVLKGLPAGDYTLYARAVLPEGAVESPQVDFHVATVPSPLGSGPVLGLAAVNLNSGLPDLDLSQSDLSLAPPLTTELRIALPAGPDPVGVSFTFESAAGRVYAIECADSLTPGAWTALTGFVSAGGLPRTVTVADVRGAGSQRFYRLKLTSGAQE